MTIAKAICRKSIVGWMIVPLNSEAEPLVARLYGYDTYAELKAERPSERGLKGELPELVRRIKLVADRCCISVSLCGKKDSPTVCMWDRAVVPVEHGKVSVDLKWSLWTAHVVDWIDRAGQDVVDKMRLAFEGKSGPLDVSTSPRKEIRCGCVTIRKGRADGYFATEWDEPHELADTLGLVDWNDEEDRLDWKVEDPPEGMSQEDINTSCEDAFRESIPFSIHTYEPGMDREFEVKARTFALLLERIDAEEDALLEEDRKEWALIESIYKK